MIKVAALLQGAHNEDIKKHVLLLRTIPKEVLSNPNMRELSDKFHAAYINRFGPFYKCVVFTKAEELPPFFLECFSIDENTGDVIKEGIKKVRSLIDTPVVTGLITYQVDYPS